MEFEAGEIVEGDRDNGGVFGEDGSAGRVPASDHAADVHGGSLDGMREGYNRFEGIEHGDRGRPQRTQRGRKSSPAEVAEEREWGAGGRRAGKLGVCSG